MKIALVAVSVALFAACGPSDSEVCAKKGGHIVIDGSHTELRAVPVFNGKTTSIALVTDEVIDSHCEMPR